MSLHRKGDRNQTPEGTLRPDSYDQGANKAVRPEHASGDDPLAVDATAVEGTPDLLHETTEMPGEKAQTDPSASEGPLNELDSRSRDLPESRGDSYATILHSQRTGESTKSHPHLPGFRIIEELGRGEFGVVYKAIEEKLDRTVAIKLPLLHEASLREQYISEARNAAKLDSPGIVTVYQVGQSSDEEPFVVQKYVDGHTLAHLLKEKGTLEIEEAARVIMHMARAIAIAHHGDIVHRDLKPANILMDKSGNPWVADFGLAVFEEDQVKHRNQLAGTPLYMSPEQMRGESHMLDGRTDIWSMGIMLYECLCGKTPFHGRSLAEIQEQILKRDPKPLVQRSPNIPEELDRIFRKCCSKAASDRYQSASQLADDLERFLRQRDGKAPEAKPTSKRWQAGVPTLLVVGMMAVVIIVGLSGMGVLSWLGKSPPLGQGDAPGLSLAERQSQEGLLPSESNGQIKNNSQNTSDQAIDAQGANGPDSVASDSAQQSDDNHLQAEQLTRPLIVSADGSGTHTTINAAIAQAAENQEIRIAPGRYDEHVIVEKPIALKGSRREEVFVNGTGAAAFEIVGKGHISVENLTISTLDVNGQGLNAIELKSGALELIGCTFEGSSFNSIHADPGTELEIDNCDFTAQEQPAIYAKELIKLSVENSRFQMMAKAAAPADKATLVIGMQVIKTTGMVADCTFKGTGAMGIHWKDTDLPVTIENSIFSQLDVGMRLEGCEAIQIGSARGNTFNRCIFGIDMERCGGWIRKGGFSGTSKANSDITPSGMKILGRGAVPVEISDCEINSYANGLQSKGGNIEIIGLDCHNATVEAISLSDTSAKLSDCNVNGRTGINAAGASNLVVESTSFTSSEIIPCGIGILISGGSKATIRNAHGFDGCVVDCYLEWGQLELENVTMSGFRGVLVKDQTPESAQHVRELIANNVIFTRDASVSKAAESETADAKIEVKAIEFQSKGSYRLSDCFLESPQGDPVKPSISGGLKERIGENGHIFVE